MLTGCLGGTIAQQVARSIATSMADSAVANAMDVQELEQQDRYALQKKTLGVENTLSTNNAISQQNTGLQPNSKFQQNADIQQNLALQNAIIQNTTVLNTFKNTPPDPYKLAFVSARFNELKPTLEPLPEQLTEAETPIAAPIVMLENNQSLQGNELIQNRLVQVELFNLLIGEEKAAVYTKAQLLGATSLPKQREWKLWRVATGVIKNSAEKTNTIKSVNKNLTLTNPSNATDSPQIITFLIPPEFGRLPSGGVALVEIASPGELNIARYKIN